MNGKRGAVLEAAGGVAGGIAGAVMGFLYPCAIIVLQRSVGITDPHRPATVTQDGPVEYGVGSVGYWASWIATFAAIIAIGVMGSRYRHTRAAAVPATMAFAIVTLPLALLFIAFDFGGAPHPS
ncbi:hypothetical protein ACFRAQ_02655 [Nocardia sp. NPDC056611]|uniref:hypothetical protein n=1 Tax=Nocardia sp. NPDC056611 TaxID=3345877 RepID=UPI00366EDBAF